MASLDDWLSAMRRGDFEAAWQISDRSLADATIDWTTPRHEQKIWRGQPLENKRVLVRCYHGLGDTIQFVRFVPLLQRIAKQVILWVQPSLIPLLQRMQNAPELLPLHDGTPGCAYDADVELMELAHVFRVTEDSLPPPPHFDLEPARGAFPPGIVWKSGDWDPRRDVPYEQLAEAVGEHISLQHDGHPLARDPLNLARLMLALPMVVTIDSMAAHLAGTLGVKTITLLRKDCDWRWMENRDDTPWYRSMRLLRQREEGDWQPVLYDLVRYSTVTIGQPTTFPSASACG